VIYATHVLTETVPATDILGKQ